MVLAKEYISALPHAATRVDKIKTTFQKIACTTGEAIKNGIQASSVYQVAVFARNNPLEFSARSALAVVNIVGVGVVIDEEIRGAPRSKWQPLPPDQAAARDAVLLALENQWKKEDANTVPVRDVNQDKSLFISSSNLPA